MTPVISRGSQVLERAAAPCHTPTSATYYLYFFVFNFLSHSDVTELFNTLLLIYYTEKLVPSYFWLFYVKYESCNPSPREHLSCPYSFQPWGPVSTGNYKNFHPKPVDESAFLDARIQPDLQDLQFGKAKQIGNSCYTGWRCRVKRKFRYFKGNFYDPQLCMDNYVAITSRAYPLVSSLFLSAPKFSSHQK